MTKEKLKHNVLKYLNKNGETFCSITSVLLNTGIEQYNIQYLLNELEHDELIFLAKDNDRLNSAGPGAHVLNSGSRIRARITSKGRTHVKEHIATSILDYLEKHPAIRTVVLIGGIGGGIAIIIALIAAMA
jgi:DNA-binding transcriptional ArsR family regulator